MPSGSGGQAGSRSNRGVGAEGWEARHARRVGGTVRQPFEQADGVVGEVADQAAREARQPGDVGAAEAAGGGGPRGGGGPAAAPPRGGLRGGGPRGLLPRGGGGPRAAGRRGAPGPPPGACGGGPPFPPRPPSEGE